MVIQHTGKKAGRAALVLLVRPYRTDCSGQQNNTGTSARLRILFNFSPRLFFYLRLTDTH